MKTIFPLCFVLLAGCETAYSREPAHPFEPGESRPVVRPPAREPSPVPMPEQLLGPRESAASLAGQRINRLDDRVSALKARCDAVSTRPLLEPSFEKLKQLRESVLTALVKLRDPMIGLDAGENGVNAAIAEFEIAIDALAERIERLQPLSRM
jgi:hypothetical protein